jgi:hypothetical protein
LGIDALLGRWLTFSLANRTEDQESVKYAINHVCTKRACRHDPVAHVVPDIPPPLVREEDLKVVDDVLPKRAADSIFPQEIVEVLRTSPPRRCGL